MVSGNLTQSFVRLKSIGMPDSSKIEVNLTDGFRSGIGRDVQDPSTLFVAHAVSLSAACPVIVSAGPSHALTISVVFAAPVTVLGVHCLAYGSVGEIISRSI